MKLPYKPFNIVLLGGPGSGKGTQANLLKEKFGMIHLSTGQLLRQEIAQRTDIGILAEGLIDHGNFCPDDVVLDMVNNRIAQERDPIGFLFDGVPRTLSQAKKMDGIEYSPAVPVAIVINLLIDEEETAKRIQKRAQLEGRKDDKIEILPQRFANYHKLTEPLIEYYQNQNKLLQINGMQEIDEVFQEILRKVEEWLMING